ncbi:multiubiquitin domain-containing protein [Roseobacter sinensis]|uniref:Multiubiquitin domain-containing protein n=1 Tax=Roseobacter sinensis TaxID=2931391 RepID=A0ABT3BKP5_9RHOB|nr:multiubiquitin domain-containing protein [Roseobacter sp. WL0113]MCV3274141.1 multiubiquitin domain-containing protein [Roseobacter sp. WL0113]
MKNGKEQKTVTIIVEGTPHDWPKKQEITYAELIALEVPDYSQHPEITYSVKFTKGNGNKPAGVLAPDGSVKVKEGMIFNVSETGQS